MTENKEKQTEGIFFEEKSIVLPSACDAGSRLGIKNILSMFMDIAMRHTEELKIDSKNLLKKSNALWVITHIKVEIKRRPEMLEKVNVITWPLKPHGVSLERSFSIGGAGRDGSEDVWIAGHSVWVFVDAKTHHIRRIRTVCYPDNLSYRDVDALTEPFRKSVKATQLQEEFGDIPVFAVRKVESTDIDMAQHMNNVVYCRWMIDTFSVEYLAEHEITGLEIDFRNECREGEMIDIYRRRTDNGWQFLMKKADGNVSVVAWLEMKNSQM